MGRGRERKKNSFGVLKPQLKLPKYFFQGGHNPFQVLETAFPEKRFVGVFETS
jgi:hypothetical protein